MKNEEIKKVWEKVFPNSFFLIQKACLGDYYFYDGFLAKSKTECSNGYFENDPLNYSFGIENGTYKEHAISLCIKPTEKYLAYSRAKLRKKTIKNITLEKLEKRFLQIKQLITDNKDNLINLCFDINDKI